jgi:hypothetical protein
MSNPNNIKTGQYSRQTIVAAAVITVIVNAAIVSSNIIIAASTVASSAAAVVKMSHMLFLVIQWHQPTAVATAVAASRAVGLALAAGTIDIIALTCTTQHSTTHTEFIQVITSWQKKKRIGLTCNDAEADWNPWTAEIKRSQRVITATATVTVTVTATTMAVIVIWLVLAASWHGW